MRRPASWVLWLLLLVTQEFRSPQAHPHVQSFARRTHRTQKSCYTHGYSLSQQGKKKISKEKRHTGRSPGETSRGLPVVSASEVTRMALVSPSSHVTTRTGKVTWALVFRIFTGLGHVGHPSHVADLSLQRD